MCAVTAKWEVPEANGGGSDERHKPLWTPAFHWLHPSASTDLRSWLWALWRVWSTERGNPKGIPLPPLTSVPNCEHCGDFGGQREGTQKGFHLWSPSNLAILRVTCRSDPTGGRNNGEKQHLEDKKPTETSARVHDDVTKAWRCHEKWDFQENQQKHLRMFWKES